MKKILSSLIFAASTLLCTVSASAAIVVSFTPSSQHVNVGETASVDVNISGLGSEILSAFDLNFFYNGAVIGSSRSANFTSSVTQLGADPVYGFDVVTTGEWGFWATATDNDATLAANQLDNFLLAQFTFSADHDGFSSFGLGPDPDYQRNFVGLNFATLDVTVGSACIAVGTGSCSVPEPSMAALIGLAMAGALLPAALRRRRESKLS